MTRLHWVRHGPTHARAMVGWSDIAADLSDADTLGRLAAHLPPDAPVIASDLQRADQTAAAIAGARPRLPADPDLREIHFGDWEMRGVADLADDARLRAFWDTPGDVRAPGGESWHEVCARVNRAVDRLLAGEPPADIVVVAHMGAILTQVQRALDVSAYAAFGHRIDTLSVTELHLRDDGWHAARINHRP
ncbi:histidine phosphatase family protein [Roseovarius salinarum]|uniref:histidine phosphatase family protein n=1 Tax=Roseovarius salinarum TaxID=1981892 RepID=UPI000C32088F|nr:histidine phosphatase family protein [Roseovarius salinarum]